MNELNKAHTLLTQMLRDDTAQRTPYSLQRDDGNVTYDPEYIAKTFHNLFSKLYSLLDMLPANTQDQHRLLKDFPPESCRYS